MRLEAKLSAFQKLPTAGASRELTTVASEASKELEPADAAPAKGGGWGLLSGLLTGDSKKLQFAAGVAGQKLLAMSGTGDRSVDGGAKAATGDTVSESDIMQVRVPVQTPCDQTNLRSHTRPPTATAPTCGACLPLPN